MARMDLGLTGARALVGGGSRGLGGAIAEALAAEGARVAVVSRPGAGLDAQAARLGGLAVGADLSTTDGPAAAVEAATGAWGGLDLLVVNSGGPPPGRFEDLDEATWLRAIDGTLLSAIRLLRAALPYLRQGRDPAILIILSSSVREPIPGLTTSNLIRPGLAGLLKSLVEEIAPVRINGAGPGPRRHGPDRPAGRGARRRGRRRGRGDPAPDDRADPARALRRSGRTRSGRGVPAVAGRVLRDRARSCPVDGGMIKALP